MVDRVKIGRANRRHGAEFEKAVRKDLESKGWIVSKWMNNVGMWNKDGKEVIKKKGKYFVGKTEINFEDIIFDKIIPAKSNRFKMRTCGFPDFVCIKEHDFTIEVIGVECKTNGRLSPEEKEKCEWLLNNNVFSKILIASKGDNKEIVYKDLKNKKN